MSATAAHLIAQSQHVYAVHPIAAYTLIYIGTILFGNVVVLGAAWLAWLGNFGTWGITLTLAVVLAAHISGDMIWYWCGRLFADTGFGRWIRGRLPASEKFENFLDKNRVVLIAGGKLFATPVIPILFLAGWHHMPFRRYLRVSVISTLIWFPIILAIGFGVLSGATALGDGSVWVTLSVLVGFLVASFFVLQYVVMPRLKKYWK